MAQTSSNFLKSHFCVTSTHFVHILDCLGLYIFFENGRFAYTKRSFFNEIAHSSKRLRCTKLCFLQCFLRVLSRGRFAPPGARAQERPTTHQQLADFDAPRPHIHIHQLLLVASHGYIMMQENQQAKMDAPSCSCLVAS